MYQLDTMKKAILSEVSVPARGAPTDKSPILCSAQQYHVSRTILPATLKSAPLPLYDTHFWNWKVQHRLGKFEIEAVVEELALMFEW